MPMLDAYIPAGALSDSAESELVTRLTDLLLEHEGVASDHPVARQLAWVFVHRPEVYVAGRRPDAPRYRFICQVPEGQYDETRRAEITAGITQAVAQAEGGEWPATELRTVIFTCEVPEGWWSGGSRILGLADIYELVWPLRPGMNGEARQAAARVLAERRRAQAEELLAAARPDDRTESAT